MDGVHDPGPFKGWLLKVRRRMGWLIAQRFVIFVLAVVLAFWGVLLLLPLSTFASSAYSTFRLVGLSENDWGAIFLGTATLISAGVVLNRPRVLIVGLIGAAALYTFMAVMFFVGNIAGLGWVGQAGYTALSLYVLRRLTW